MKHAALAVLLLVESLGLSSSPSESISPLQRLLAPHEYQQYQESERYKDRIDLFRKALERYRALLNSSVAQGQENRLVELLKNMGALSRHATEDPSRSTANPKDLRSAEVKKLEILLRRQIRDLNALRFSVRTGLRKDLEDASRNMKRLRQQLLQQFFVPSPPPEDEGAISSGRNS